MENRLQYYMRVIKGASFEKFSKVLNNAHERSGKSKIFIFFDMINCTLRYLLPTFWLTNRLPRPGRNFSWICAAQKSGYNALLLFYHIKEIFWRYIVQGFL